jgi:hypothetical protein
MNPRILLCLAILNHGVFASEPDFMQTSDGLVVIEAEHFHSNTPQGTHTWATVSDAKASNGNVVTSQPADQARFDKKEEFTVKSPRLDYKVTFLMPGRHFLWVRGQGAFVHLGLDGVPITHSQRIGGFNSKSLEWRFQTRANYGRPAYLDVPSAGKHTINLWMQTAGTAVDQIILTPQADYKAGNDMTESPRGKLPPQAPWVNAGPEQEINPPNDSVNLEGAARDYDGNVTGYAWSQVDGPATATFTTPDKAATRASGLTAIGAYRFRLTVQDDSKLSFSRDVTVNVTPRVPPTLEVAAEIILITDTAVNLTATGADADSDDKIQPLTYKWEQVGGPSQAQLKIANRNQAVLSKLVDGAYVFRASVTDFTGNTTTAESKVVKRPVPVSSAIDADDPAIQYSGRFLVNQKSPKIRESGWPATSICARFEGTSIRVRLSLDGWGGASRFYAIIDGKADKPVVLGGDNRTDWLIAENLSNTTHQIELVRLGGAWNASSKFSGFFLDAGKILVEPPSRFTRRIEFYGDSITEGAMMSDQAFGNGYLAYAATTARLLKAESSVVCKSGMGLVKGFTLPQTLPGMFDRTVPMRGDIKWDFSKWTPHVVVVNIGQNDSWTGADPAVFIDTYVSFIKTLRGHYPKARIICALGSMDATAPNSKWPGYVGKAVERLKTEDKDTLVETFFFEFLGAKGHPNSKQARDMAEKLAAFLEAKGPQLWN